MDNLEARQVQDIRTGPGRADRTGVVQGAPWMLPVEIHSLVGL